MTIATDFEIQNDKDIRYIGAAHGARFMVKVRNAAADIDARIRHG